MMDGSRQKSTCDMTKECISAHLYHKMYVPTATGMGADISIRRISTTALRHKGIDLDITERRITVPKSIPRLKFHKALRITAEPEPNMQVQEVQNLFHCQPQLKKHNTPPLPPNDPDPDIYASHLDRKSVVGGI